MARYRCRPNVMLAAPSITLPTAILRHVCVDLLDRPDPAWQHLAHLVSAQLFPGSPCHTVTLAAQDLQDLLVVLLETSIDFGDGKLAPEACGFTEDDIHEAIDLHQHHYGPLQDY
ncbi:hypothetical protein [Streptomyces anulatus]|uniref:hypothetical protein n=1 Tax=Streptomyces anulatus TaxID=1892 RepID=UPI001C254FEF|nr:hypothetical protein [Streptomyces anulatus]